MFQINKIITIFKQYEVVLNNDELNYIKDLTNSNSLEEYLRYHSKHTLYPFML